jgi:hypothetical protein
MKKILVAYMTLILFAGISTAQTQFENPGFEDWEDILASETDTIREPVDWSSLKTSDNPTLSSLAPVVLKRSSLAHSGNFSMQLTNVMSFIVVNGAACNGRIHPNISTELSYSFTDTLDSQWNTPLTARPDSVAGWYMYTPQGSDTMQFKVALHRDFGKQPDADYMDNWTGVAQFNSALNTAGEWKRFSVPFVYYSDEIPEYALVVMNSGNGFLPVAGSIVLFDDIEMIYNSPQVSVNTPENPAGFIYAVENRLLVIRGMKQDLYNSAAICDVAGRLVWSGKVTSDRIDLSSAKLKNGIYLVTLSGLHDVYTQKIMLH